MKNLDLSQNFPQASYDDWLGLVAKGLKDAEFESLILKTDDDIARGPLTTLSGRPDITARHSRGAIPLTDGRPWHIAAPVRDPDISFANDQAIKDLEGGASALRISIDPTGKNGTAVQTVNDIHRLLDRVHTDLIPINLAPSPHSIDASALLCAAGTLNGAHINLGIDVIADGLTTGNTIDLGSIGDILNTASDNWRVLTVNAAKIHEHGGTEAQELTYMAGAVTAYMREFDPQTIGRSLNIELATDQDGHFNIAKIRAARRIYARIAESFGLTDHFVPIHVITSQRMMQAQDPWSNMLRVVSAAFGAVCGGANMITTRPLTDALGLATPFGHRIARNIQLMLMEESHLGQVDDVAYGSYTHERLTDNLAQTAWTEFQAIETGGGITRLVENGIFPDALKNAARQREEKAAPIIGVSLHPAPDLRAADIRKAPALKPRKLSLIDAESFTDKIKQAQAGHGLGA